MVNKFTTQPTNKEVVTKINDVIDNLGTFLQVKGTITSSTVLTNLETGIYTVEGITHAGFPNPSQAYYGVLIQYGGTYKPQLLVAGVPASNGFYYRRYLTGSSSFTAWGSIPTIPTNISAFTNDVGYTTNIGTVTSVNSTQPDANGNVTLTVTGGADTDLSNLSATGKKVLDGQWVFSYKELTTATSAGSREHDLSTYLPNDSSSYEVFATVRLASTSSSTIEISLGTSASPVTNTTSCLNIYAAKSGSTGYSASNTGILPVGTGRKLYSQISGGSANVSWIRVYGYRRIGTNT